MNTTIKNQKGAVLIIFALLLIVLIGFTALAVDVGRWYTTRSELSKSVDAGAIAGAKNISNPYLGEDGHLRLAEEVARENFSVGYLMTPDSGEKSATFTAYADDDHRIRVEGTVSSPGNLAGLFGVDWVATNAMGVAKKNEVEIMLVLDRSGSMDGTPMRDLKKAARSFVSFFEETQDQDKMGLVSFATSVKVDVPLGNNYVSSMTSKINAMDAVGATNAEDSLSQAGNPAKGGLTDQSGVPGNKRVQQFVIFFSDGNPTAFRGKFKYNGTDNIDAVVCGTGNDCGTVYTMLGKPEREEWLRYNPRFTGDGNPKPPGTGTSKCTKQYGGSYVNTTKWYVLDDPDYRLTYRGTTYNSESCFIPTVGSSNTTAPLSTYICTTARGMAVEHAQELKDNNVKIYTIGLGNIDRDFLSQIASGPSFEFYAPTSGELQAIFNKIAKDIKLRLVQ
jgi:uncharacterized protein YegL